MELIGQILERMLSKSYREQLRIERDVQTYLSALPTSYQFMLIAGLEFGEGEYDPVDTLPR